VWLPNKEHMSYCACQIGPSVSYRFGDDIQLSKLSVKQTPPPPPHLVPFDALAAAGAEDVGRLEGEAPRRLARAADVLLVELKVLRRAELPALGCKPREQRRQQSRSAPSAIRMAAK
jgi:hypothetical protein